MVLPLVVCIIVIQCLNIKMIINKYSYMVERKRNYWINHTDQIEKSDMVMGR